MACWFRFFFFVAQSFRKEVTHGITIDPVKGTVSSNFQYNFLAGGGSLVSVNGIGIDNVFNSAFTTRQIVWIKWLT